MFLKISARCITSLCTPGHRLIHRAAITLVRAHPVTDINSVKLARKNDISEVIELEANLFENSAHHNKPISTKDLLDQYKPKQKHYAKRNFNNHKTYQKDARRTVSVPSEPPPKPSKVKSEIILNDDLGIPYTKLHLNDPWLNALMMTAKSRKNRLQKHQLLIEGRRLIVEALAAGLQLEYVLFSDIDQVHMIKEQLAASLTKLIKVPQTDLRFWSNLSTCPGMMGVFIKPLDMSHIWKPSPNTLPITVICDQIREPNNLGSIIRNCAAISCEQVLVTKGCADPWESKALRGGAGAQFHVPIRGPLEWSSVHSILPADNCFIYLAENNKDNALAHIPDAERQSELIVPYCNVSYVGKHCVVVIGGETHGISTEAYQLLDSNVLGKCIHIPLATEVESLNTASALAVILFEIKKQMAAKQ